MNNFYQGFSNTGIPKVGVIYNWGLFQRDVRNDVRNCALVLFLFYTVYVIAAGIYMVVEMFSQTLSLSSGLSEQGAMDPVEALNNMDKLINDLDLGLMSIVSIAAGSLVFFILRKRRFITDLALPSAEPMTPKIFIILIMATQCIQLIFGLISMLIEELLPKGMSMEESYAAAMEGLFTPTGLLYVILIGPIFEELIFRGAVMGSLRRFGDNFAIVFSSILFGFYHMQIAQIPFAIVTGLLLGYVAARWSLRAAIALHMIVNGLSTLFSYIEGETLSGAVGLIMLACTVVTVIMLIVWRDAFRMRVNAGAAYYPKTYTYGFSSIAFWLFIAMCGVASVFMLNMDNFLPAGL